MTWPKVTLSEVLTRSEESILLEADSEYSEITVKLWGKGVILRGRVTGATIAGSRRFCARAGQFILSRIDARNGATGIVPEELDGAVVTNDFPLFNLNLQRVDPKFLGWFGRTSDFVDLCRRASEGTTNRVRLQEDLFLQLEIPLPPLGEQKRVVARIEELLHLIRQAQAIRKISDAELDSFWPSLLQQLLTGQKFDICSPEGTSAEVLLYQSIQQWNKIDFPNHNNAHPYDPVILKEGPVQLPQGWVWTTLGSVLTHLVDCVNDTPSFSQENTGYIGLKTTNIKPYNMDLSLKWYMTQEDFNSWNRREVPKPQDIILTREAPVGNACLVPCDLKVCLTQRLLLLRPNKEIILPGLLLHFFNSNLFFNQVIEHSRGLTTPHIRVQDAPRIMLPLPPMELQHSLLSLLDELLRLYVEAKKIRSGIANELDAFVSSVLNRAFSGQL